jgi:squalene-hopene/tetraprenyl-beta-curcumene cyclase
VKNYETSLAIQCFSAANMDGRYKPLLAKADKFIKTIQSGGEPSEFTYGGSGYEPKKKRPDLSNTSFLLDALQASGVGPDDEAVKRALVFVSRCQNLETEHNTTSFAAKNPDGGFYYTPAAGGVSEAGQTDEGGLRSYGSMTYAGLKSMIFAGVKADDPRVKAAVSWIKKHYTLSANPGMPKPAQGLYYYLHTFAKAMSAMGLDVLEDDKGVKHPWRHDLLVELAKQQRPDGSWVNVDPRFLEGNTNLVTAYALLALSYAQPAK